MLLWSLFFTYDANNICCLVHDEYIINVVADLKTVKIIMSQLHLLFT